MDKKEIAKKEKRLQSVADNGYATTNHILEAVLMVKDIFQNILDENKRDLEIEKKVALQYKETKERMYKDLLELESNK